MQKPRIRWDRRVDPLAVPAETINRPRLSPGSGPQAAELERAARELREGDRDEALARIVRAMAAPDTDRQGIRFGAFLLRAAGEAARAVPAMERAFAGAPGDPSPEEIVERIATLEAAGLQDPAARMAREQAGRDPDRFASPSCLRAEALALLVREGVPVDAVVGRGPLPLSPFEGRGSRCAWLLQLHRATRQGDGDGVVRAARAALQAVPDDRDVLYLWGHFFFVRHRLDEALDPWDRLAALEPTYPSLMSLYGTAYLVSGRLQREGIEALLERHRKRPDDAVAAYLAGLGLFYQKEYPRVIPLLAQAAAAVPEDPRPAMYLAMAHFFTGDRDEAIRILEGLERFTWQEPDINYCRSLVYRSTDLPRAIREMETFLRVFEGEDRVSFGPQKVQKARSDLERMRRGEVPEVFLPQPDGWDERVLEVQHRIDPPPPETGHDPR
jgi:thioredoxin-like negative regulator of GroEL